jgi:hypothetical protein
VHLEDGARKQDTVTQQTATSATATAGDASRARLTSSIPVRFPDETLEVIRARADADHRTVSSWIRHVVQQELEREAS